jgi:hypothetical protein
VLAEEEAVELRLARGEVGEGLFEFVDDEDPLRPPGGLIGAEPAGEEGDAVADLDLLGERLFERGLHRDPVLIPALDEAILVGEPPECRRVVGDRTSPVVDHLLRRFGKRSSVPRVSDHHPLGPVLRRNVDPPQEIGARREVDPLRFRRHNTVQGARGVGRPVGLCRQGCGCGERGEECRRAEEA